MFSIRLKVRYAETDQMGVVYYANYFVWMEVVRTEWFEQSCGLSYAELERQGLFLPVIETSCNYRQPIYYPEEVKISVKPCLHRDLYLEFDYQFSVENEIRAMGFSRHVFLNKERKIQRIDGTIKRLLNNAGLVYAS